MLLDDFKNIRRHPKRRINPEFRDAVCLVRRERVLAKDICLVVGFPQQSDLSEILHRPFIATQQRMDRLQRLANFIGFEGELLAEDTGKAVPALERHDG